MKIRVPCAVHNCKNRGWYRIISKRHLSKATASIAFYYYCKKHAPKEAQ